jgi:hypothetical protein
MQIIARLSKADYGSKGWLIITGMKSVKDYWYTLYPRHLGPEIRQ